MEYLHDGSLLLFIFSSYVPLLIFVRFHEVLLHSAVMSVININEMLCLLKVNFDRKSPSRLLISRKTPSISDSAQTLAASVCGHR